MPALSQGFTRALSEQYWGLSPPLHLGEWNPLSVAVLVDPGSAGVPPAFDRRMHGSITCCHHKCNQVPAGRRRSPRQTDASAPRQSN